MPHCILGINCAYHESSAAIIADGHLLAAVEEERLSGVRHGKALRVDNPDELPWRAIEACLHRAGIHWDDLDAIAYSLDPELRRRHARLGNDGPADTFGHPEGEAAFHAGLIRVPKCLRAHTTAPFYFVPHHEAHAWYAVGTSPFAEAAVLVMDGIGEGATLSLGWANRGHLELHDQAIFPDSVGLAWEKVARFLGLSEYDASKVMALAGLSPIGQGRSLESAFRWESGRLRVDQELFRLEYPDDFSGLEKWCGWSGGTPQHPRGLALATALQRATEQLLITVARELRQRHTLSNLAYGGGVALNCRANEVLARSGVFEQIHAGPASHDGGTAVGAAWQVYTDSFGRPLPRQEPARLVFGGPAPTSETSPAGWSHRRGDAVTAALAQLLEGGVVGWAVGPCELGPRALGGRSLLASPISPAITQRLNRFKGRQPFEPIALSITDERADEWFDIPAAARELTPYMLTTVQPRPAKSSVLAHLLHRDGTVRLQTVSPAFQPRFHALLSRFGEMTGHPFLVNTSFNRRGEPMSADLRGVLASANRLGLKDVVTDTGLWSRDGEQAVRFPDAAGMNDSKP